MQTAVRFAPEVPVLVSPTTESMVNKAIAELNELVQYQEWWDEHWAHQFIEYDPARECLESTLEGWRIRVRDYIPGAGGFVFADKFTWENQVNGVYMRDYFGEPTKFAWYLHYMLTNVTVPTRETVEFQSRNVW